MTMFQLARRSLSSSLAVILTASGWVCLTVVGIVQADQHSSLYSVEYPLAQSQQLYVIIDSQDRMVWIKARGIPVRKFSINAMTWLGDPIAQLSVFTIESKQPVIESPPSIPSSPDQQEVQRFQKPLMVSDMPTHFEIVLQGGGALMIQSIRTTSILQTNWDVLSAWMSRTYSRMTAWGQGLWGEAPSRLVLEMTPAEAQGLYWALVPLTRVIWRPET